MADLCILYEVTGYQDESADADFWNQYMDFFELGKDENLIRKDKMQTAALPPDRRNEYMNHVQEWENQSAVVVPANNITTPGSRRGAGDPLLPTSINSINDKDDQDEKRL